MSTFQGIRYDDCVTYRTPQGGTHTGRAQLLLTFHTHVVVDAGKGLPVVVNGSNYVSHVAKAAA